MMSEMTKITFLEPNGGCARKDRSPEEFAAAKDDLELYAMYDPNDRGEMPYYNNREKKENK